MSRATRFKQSIGIRTKPPANLPVEFMQDHMNGDLSPAVASPPLQYASEISAFVRADKKKELETLQDSLFDDAKTELEELRKAVVQYEQKTKSKSHIDVQTCTWTGVQEAIQTATLGEGSDDESNIAKRSCSKMARNIPYFETWLSLLPDGDYGAVVCGVFKMVVVGAKRANDVRITIFKTLAEIPESVARAAEYRMLYEDTRPQELIEKTAQLCKAILIALRHVMVYFTEGIIKGSVKAMLQGSVYKKNLQSHLDDVKELAMKIDQEAIVRSQHSVRYIEKHVQRIEQEVIKLQSCSKSVQVDEATLQDFVTRIGHLLEEKFVNSTLGHFSSHAAIGSRSVNSMNSQFNLQHRNTDQLLLSREQILLVSPSSMESATPTPVVNKETLLLILHASDMPTRDLQLCLQKGRLLNLEDQDRVKWIMRSSQFREWLSHPTSKTILINGNGSGNETFSPMTFLSAKLLETLGNIKPIITFNFFCSLHATSKGSMKDDAFGMIKSFIAQLIVRNVTWDLTFLTQEELNRIGTNDFSSLCNTLLRLLRQLPNMTLLFWTIDGVTFYERGEWRTDLLKAISELLKIMASCKKIVIKLLLTCHGRSAFVKDCVDDKDILVVPSTIDGGCQGWNDQVWESSMEKNLESLEGAALDGEP